jgi:hypothetical protein
MPWEALAFLGTIIGIPIIVAWIVGGEKKSKAGKAGK